MSKAKQEKDGAREEEGDKLQPETAEREEETPEPKTEVENLKEQLKKSGQKARELEDRLLRLAADLEEQQRRDAAIG